MTAHEGSNVVSIAADIVSAYVSNNRIPATDLSGLIGSVHKSLSSLTGGGEPVSEPLKPAVPVNRSVHDDYLICLEDGKKFKSLKRHLGVLYGLTPDEYRKKWNLPAAYPMGGTSLRCQQIGLCEKNGTRAQGEGSGASCGQTRKTQDRVDDHRNP